MRAFLAWLFDFWGPGDDYVSLATLARHEAERRLSAPAPVADAAVAQRVRDVGRYYRPEQRPLSRPGLWRVS